jgi:hypothetical protein
MAAVAGCTAGAAQCFLYSPVELVKLRLQLAPVPGTKRRHLAAATAASDPHSSTLRVGLASKQQQATEPVRVALAPEGQRVGMHNSISMIRHILQREGLQGECFVSFFARVARDLHAGVYMRVHARNTCILEYFC